MQQTGNRLALVGNREKKAQNTEQRSADEQRRDAKPGIANSSLVDLRSSLADG